MKKLLVNIGKKSKIAFSISLNSDKKNKVLKDYFQLIEKNKKLILRENLKDIKNAYRKKLKENLVNRLYLNEKKILDIINSIKKIIKLIIINILGENISEKVIDFNSTKFDA